MLPFFWRRVAEPIYAWSLLAKVRWRQKAETEGHRTTGWVSQKQVQQEIEKARTLVFPSLWPETYGLVVAEAAARGVPSIVSDVSAAAERINDGKNGWLWKTGNVEDLVRCINATKDGLTVKSSGLASYEEFWSNPPTKDNHVKQLLTIYQNVLAASNSKKDLPS